MQRRRQPIKKQFQQKHIKINISPSDIIPAKPDENYSLATLIDIKNTLNDAKSQLDTYWNISKTDKKMERRLLDFQNIIDLYKPMRAKIAAEFNAKHVTNAWMKYWEIYSEYNIIPSHNDGKFIAFFNAELPGAALCAFNHYMKTMRRDVDFDWRASSLAPGESAKNMADALGDNYGLYNHNKNKWLMTLPTDAGPRKNNGDATNINNILDFAELVGPNSPLGGVHLYSHDAGMDVSDDFNNQESINARLHLGCALTGFLTLRPGGAFIAKQYTFFETCTWNLLLIYAQLFDTFYICKPLTSRPYNSEIYLIGIGFRGINDEIKQILINKLTNFDMNPLISEDAIKVILSKQVNELDNAARIIFKQQTAFLQENIKLFNIYQNNLHTLKTSLRAQADARISFWLKNYPVKKISETDQLPSN